MTKIKADSNPENEDTQVSSLNRDITSSEIKEAISGQETTDKATDADTIHTYNYLEKNWDPMQFSPPNNV